MKKILNISLILKIVGIIVFGCVLIFQNQLVDWTSTASFVDERLYVSTGLIITNIISLVAFVISYLFVLKGSKNDNTNRFEILAIILLIVVSIVNFFISSISANDLSEMENLTSSYVYKVNIINAFSSLINYITSLGRVLFYIATGISIGKKVKN